MGWDTPFTDAAAGVAPTAMQPEEQPDSEAASTEAGRDADVEAAVLTSVRETIAERLRFFALAIATIVAAIEVARPLAGLFDPLGLHVVRLALAGLWGLAAFSLRGREQAARVVPTAVALALLCSVTTAVDSVLRGLVEPNFVLAAIVSLGTSSVFPWGIGPQIVVILGGMLATYWAVVVVTGDPSAAIHPAVVAPMGLVYAVSLLVAFEMRRSLERSVEQTAAIARARDALARSEAHLRRVNGELQRFAYTVSHDLKAPLVSIGGFADLLRKDIEAEDRTRALDDLDEIVSASSGMHELLDGVLHLSRAGRALGDVEAVALDELVAEVAATFAPQLESAGGRIDLHDALPVVSGDRLRLRQVFQNLIGNCIKFRDPARPLRIGIGHRDAEGGTVVYVEDNGVGVDEEQRENVFALFDRGDADRDGSEDGEDGGSGVGLALVNAIAEAHGGSVWMEANERGPGVRVCIQLSAVRALPA